MEHITILCETCIEAMGTISKPEISAQDILLYGQMMTCPNGHSTAGLIDTPEGLTSEQLLEE